MTVANIITIIRISLVPLFIYLIYKAGASGMASYRIAALTVFILASFTDFLDGYTARRLNQVSDSGRVLDVTADKLLIISSIVILTFYKNLPINLPYWVAVVIIFRDLFIIIGIFYFKIKYNKLVIKPNIYGKIGITFEMLMIISVLFSFKYSFLVWQAAALFAIISALVYTIETQRLIKEYQI
jgi:CDP-diacylglycerol--glycerol-3-phosphate 3-phosphatidyltransferase